MNIQKLKEFPKNLYLFIITIVCFLIFILINQLVFAPYSATVPTYGILDFEFAWIPEQILVIFAAWGSSGIAINVLGVWWDFLYIIGYGFFIFGAILLVTRQLEGRFQMIGLWMSLTPLVAGIFDVVENINLLIMLYNTSAFPAFVPFIASLTATIKFTLLIIGILYFFIALIGLAIKLFIKKK
jgi:hypothetical protein